MEVKTEILFIIAMLSIFLIGSHLHDISGHISFVVPQEVYDEYMFTPILTNGFFDISPAMLSHIGWYMMYFSFFVLVVGYVCLLLEVKNGKMP